MEWGQALVYGAPDNQFHHAVIRIDGDLGVDRYLRALRQVWQFTLALCQEYEAALANTQKYWERVDWWDTHTTGGYENDMDI